MNLRALRRAALPLTVAGCFLAGCSLTGSNDSTVNDGNADFGITYLPADEREPAPVINGADLDGVPVSTGAMSGKTIVVNVWGSWCGPCRAEAPTLQRVSSEYVAKNVEFIGINIRDNAAQAKLFNQKYGITYPSINDPGGNNLLGFVDSLPTQATPTTWIIDSEGRVAVRIVTDQLTGTTLSGLIDDVQTSTQT